MLGVPSGCTIWQDLPLYPAGPVNALFQLPAQARSILCYLLIACIRLLTGDMRGFNQQHVNYKPYQLNTLSHAQT